MTTNAFRLIAIMATMPDDIIVVRRTSIPSQIIDVVVAPVPVLMTCLHAKRTWANEQFQYEPVDVKVPLLRVAEIYDDVP